MAGIADLMYGPGAAQAFAVPDPQVSMADILAGGIPAATPAPAGVSTAYGDSPAPGAVAAAGAQANAAAAGEPGIVDQARSWATKNPVQAQALMQGFAALAGGKTRGGFIQQLGQGAGVVNQTMVEQTAANAAQQRETDAQNRRLTLAEQEGQSQIGARTSATARAEAEAPGRLRGQDLTNRGTELRNTATEQATGQSAQMFTPKMDMFRKQMQKLDSDILSAGTEREAAQIRVKKAKLEADIYGKFGEKEAQAILDYKAAQTGNEQERGLGIILDNQGKIMTQEELNKLTPEQKSQHVLGIKPKEHKNPQDVALELLNKDGMKYMKKDGTTDYQKLAADTNAILRGGGPPPEDQSGFDAAMNRAKPGEVFEYDGRRFRRPK